MPSSNSILEGEAVPLEQFRALTRMPIVVYYGDNIPAEPTDIAGRDNWRSGSQWPGFGRMPSPARR
jgi:hypothetical protein